MSTAEGVRGLRYETARRLLLAVGIAVLLLTVAVRYVRRVDTTEVLATVPFVPVFVALVFGKVGGGLAAGVAAAIAYAALRYPAIDAVGADRFSGLIASRSIAFVAFGLLGGWANRQLQASLTKLELYDQVDDSTGLFNARFFVEDLDLEMSRSKRYQTIFSVALIDIPISAFEALSRRRKSGLLRDLGKTIKDSVRTVDRAVHGRDASHDRFAVVLPETGPEGARIFTQRLAARLAEYLEHRGAAVTLDDVRSVALTYPDDEGALFAVRSEFAEIDRIEHPEAPATADQGGTGEDGQAAKPSA